MSTDYHSINANELVRGQVLLDQGSDRKIVGIHKLPGRIYVYIQKDVTKAQLQFSPLEEVFVRNVSSDKQTFSATFSNTPQPKTQVENDGNTEPYLPYSAFDLSNISEELSSPHPELDLSNEAAKLHVSDSDPKGMTEQVKHGLAEVLRSEEKGQEGYYLKVNGDGTVIPKHFSLINSPILTPYPLTPHLYQE